MRGHKARRTAGRVAASLGLLLFTGGVSFPVVWMGYSSLKTNAEIYQKPWGLPERPVWENLTEAWQVGGLGRYVGNSVLVTASAVLLIVFAASLCGYACARLPFRGKNWIQSLFLLGLVLPIQAAVIPLYYLLKQIGLLNHRAALILPYAAWGLPIAMFIFRGFFAQIPKEYDEAGRIDGCGEFSLYWKIFLPLCKPAAGTVALFSALSCWNELLMAVLFVQDDALKTLPVGLLAFFGYRQADYSLLLSGLTLVTLPMLGVYFALQRTLMKGLTGGLGDLR